MNIKISYNWLLEYLDTAASPYDLQKYLSLCGPSVERVEKVGTDYLLDIEITSNRVDMASVYGIAREAAAILPQFGVKAKLNNLNLQTPKLDREDLKLTLINDNILCRRVMGVVLDDAIISTSPDFMKDRLEKSGIRSLNNIVDITNYVMLEIGHPTHVFDYDKITTQTLKIRASQKGEKIVTLDNKQFALDDGDVVIENGQGQIIDLPGIMGTANSVVSSGTKRLIYFIDSINPVSIRKTSMRLGIRTLAATINEKNPSPELMELALFRGLELYKKFAKASIASKIYDLYSKPYQPKKITVNPTQISAKIGVSFSSDDIIKILNSLGFVVNKKNTNQLAVTIPYFRADDVNTLEDIVEEVARIYGYYKLPSTVQKTDIVFQPKEIEKRFVIESKIKYLLKHLGLHEAYNYSLLSKKQLTDMDLDPKNHLKLSNSISSDIEYLRISLIPSLAKNIRDNEGKHERLLFFEIANTYKKRVGDLPTEEKVLTLATNADYFGLKGIIEAIFDDLKIKEVSFIRIKTNHLLSPTLQVMIQGKNKEYIGVLGQLNEKYRLKLGLKKPIFIAEINFDKLTEKAKTFISYKPITPYATVKLDLTLPINMKQSYDEIESQIAKISPLVSSVDFISQYKNSITIRIYFTDDNRNITEKEAEEALEKIKESVR